MAKGTKRVKLKEGMGGFLRLTMPGFSLTMRGGEKDVTDEEYARIKKFVDIMPDKPTPPKKMSEVKSVKASKE